MTHLVWKTSTAALGKAIHLAAITLLALVFGTGAAFAQLNAYVANTGSGVVAIVDVATHTTISVIPVPGAPSFLAINAAGSRLYVALLGTNQVAVVNLVTNSVIATVPVGAGPFFVTLSGDEAFLYVNNNGANTMTVIDTATNTVAATLTIGGAPQGNATTPDGGSVWTSAQGGIISVIDTATNTITSTFTLPFSNSRGMVFTPDGAFAYLSDASGNRCLVVDTATQTIVATIPTGAGPFDSTITPDGATVYQANSGSASVSVIDTATNTVVATVPVGGGPAGTAITPDGAFVYVANQSGTVSVIDTATNTVIRTISQGAQPTGVAIARVIQVPPVVTADNATVTVDEGQTAANTGRVRDVNRETVTLTASVGTVVNNGNGTWSWSFNTSDGFTQSQTVTITGDDGQGGITSTTFNLVVNNVPPTIVSVTNNGPVVTGTPATITVTATDPAGANDPLAYEFDCNNDFVFEIGPQAGNSASCTFASAGSHTVNVLVNDGDGAAALGSTVVTVTVPPPNCSGAVASPNKLWPPNHKFVPVQITGVSGASSVSVTSIFQDEPTNSLGDGNTCPDGNGIGTATANLRAERAGLGNGRVYTISFTATGAGGTCQGSVTVCVPHNNNGSCGNGGALFNSGSCSGTTTLQSSAPYSGKQRKDLGLLCSSHLPTHDCDLFCDAGLILCH